MFGLDLVRALAVALVLASHCGDVFSRWFGGTNLRLLSYGAYYGIELFFVLSGFLIGGLLLEQADRSKPARTRRWLIFMVRRWMRTLPLYYVWLVVIALVWAPMLWPHGHDLTAALTRYALFMQNLAWPMRDPGLFDVSWSLAVEEWFYLGFSALLFALGAVWRRGAWAVSVAVFLLGPILCRWWLRGQPSDPDHLVVFWLDSIAIGVAMAWLRVRRPRWFAAAAWLLPVSLVLVLLTFHGGLASRLGLSGHWRRTLDVDLLAVALVLALPASCRWRHAHGPAATAVRSISRLSYALYLTHLTVLTVVEARRGAWNLPPWGAVAISVVAIAGLSYALSRLIERPIMALRPDDRPSRASRTRPAAEATHA